jgi:hypothetical protein
MSQNEDARDSGEEEQKTHRIPCPECDWKSREYHEEDEAAVITRKEDAIIHWEAEHGGAIPESAHFGDYQCPECCAYHGLIDTVSCSNCGFIPESDMDTGDRIATDGGARPEHGL